MKIIFKDGISVFNRPDVEREFNSTEELFNLLDEFGDYKYAYTAIIYDGPISIPLMIDPNGGWGLDFSAVKRNI